jgi:hypothetical protein
MTFLASKDPESCLVDSMRGRWCAITASTVTGWLVLATGASHLTMSATISWQWQATSKWTTSVSSCVRGADRRRERTPQPSTPTTPAAANSIHRRRPAIAKRTCAGHLKILAQIALQFSPRADPSSHLVGALTRGGGVVG